MSSSIITNQALGIGAIAGSQHISKKITSQINGGFTSNNISLNSSVTGNLLGANSPWHTTLEVFDEEPHIKKYQVYETTEDLLVLSATWHRLRKKQELLNNQGYFIKTITDKALFEHINSIDRENASMIRDYYSKKFLMWTLSEVPLTNFRKDLKTFINSNGKIFEGKMKPLAHRLPEFYDYDIEFDKMFVEHNTQVNQDTQHKSTLKRLSLVTTMLHKRKHSTHKEYWFSDEQDNLNLITIDKNNILINLMDLHSSNPFKINCVSSKKIRDNREYCLLEKFNFL